MATAKTKYYVFVSGPMESVGGNMNVPLFAHLTKLLRRKGCIVYNPTEYMPTDFAKMGKKDRAFARRIAMKNNTSWICEHCNAMLMLPGWKQSPGALAEHALALSLNIVIRESPTILLPTGDEDGHHSTDPIRLELFETEGV